MPFTTFRILLLFVCLAISSIKAAPGDENWDDGFAAPPGLNGNVRCSRTFGSDLYVAGPFTMAGNVEANGIARWDGHEWHAVGEGVNGEIFALTVHQNALYAGGDFQTAGTVPVTNIAKWTGQQWASLNVAPTGYSPVYALASDGRNLYAGGRFSEIGGVQAANIASWDGKNWYPLGKGVGFLHHIG